MRRHFLAKFSVIVLLSVFLCSAVEADQLVGLPDAVGGVVDGNEVVVSFTYAGTQYVVADGDLVLGTTTRWYIPASTGLETQWVDGDPVQPEMPTVAGTSNPKVGDQGWKADNFTFRVPSWTNDICSIDGIDFMQTVFESLSDTFFVFERNGNDNGTIQAIRSDGSLGPALTLTGGGSPYAATGISVGDQDAYGFVLITDAPAKGLRITASGFDALSISIPNKTKLLKARDPRPESGPAVAPSVDGSNVYLVLDYTPGKGAIMHTAYFSDSFEDVNSRDPAYCLGPPPFPIASATAYWVGHDSDPIPAFARTPLIRGRTYYWCVDEFDGEETWPGQVWSFTVLPVKAWDPGPADGAKNVVADPDVDLSWRQGDVDDSANTVTFSVFYGTDAAEVNAAMIPDGNTATTGYSIGPLAGDTVYHWRIDTVLQQKTHPFDTTSITGDLWSFTTMPEITVTDPNLVGWWKFDEGENTTVFDWSGHEHHGTFSGDPQWATGMIEGALQFDGVDDSVRIASFTPPNRGTITFWIEPESVGGQRRRIFGGHDAYESYIEPSGEIANQLFAAGGLPDYIMSSQTISAGEWIHVALTYDGTTTVSQIYLDGILDAEGYTADDPWGGGLFTFGQRAGTDQEYYHGLLDDLRIYNFVLSAGEIERIMLGDPDMAWNPSPPHGATISLDEAIYLSLIWSPGERALKHYVYLGTDEAAVGDADTSDTTGIYRPPVQEPNTYNIPEALAPGRTYYWRIDEHNDDDSVTKGMVWSFTVTNYLIVDDMETYNTDPYAAEDANWIFYVWVDGLGDYDCAGVGGNGTGANVSCQPGTVLGSLQAMQFDYDNDGFVRNPCTGGEGSRDLLYSMAKAEVADLPSGIGSDWAANGVKALSVSFYGDPLNTVEPMWVELTDSKGGEAKVAYGKYDDEDPNNLNEASWHEWNIDLSDFTGVDLNDVNSIAIGVGAKGATSAGGSGTLYFDEIRLYAPRCILSRRQANFAKLDYVADCEVNLEEMMEMAHLWLRENLDESALWAGTWADSDVGDVTAVGSFIEDVSGDYTIIGDGNDIWDQNDGFHYAYQTLSGDGQITVRVTSVQETDPWAKAGVMIRETLDDNSKHAMIIGRPGDRGIAFQWRPNTGANSQNSQNNGPDLPYCLRLVRSGDTITGYYFDNGTWNEQHSVTIPMTDPVYIGMVVTSHTTGSLCTATLDRSCSDDFVPSDLHPDDVINFLDYAILSQATVWLEEDLFP